jgi:hypothetical protein
MHPYCISLCCRLCDISQGDRSPHSAAAGRGRCGQDGPQEGVCAAQQPPSLPDRPLLCGLSQLRVGLVCTHPAGHSVSRLAQTSAAIQT